MKRQINKYRSMITGLCPNNELDALTFVIRTLRRHDRIIWALRFLKIQGLLRHNSEGIELSKSQKRYLLKYKHLQACVINRLDIMQIAHYTTQSLHCYDCIVFTDQPLDEMKRLLETAETQYLNRVGDKFRDLPEEGKVICTVHEGLVWFDLMKPSCRALGKSMGDCGNSNFISYQTVYSLREKIEKPDGVYWRPHLTFIYNKSYQLLGERKGRFNQKPNKKWHPAIVRLLCSRTEIKGLTDSTFYFKKENDFVLTDLSQEHQETLRTSRPDLMDIVANPESSTYDKDALSWIGLADTVDSTGLTSLVLRAFQRYKMSIYEPIGLQHRKLGVTLSTTDKLTADLELAFSCVPSIFDDYLSKMQPTMDNEWNSALLNCFFENPKREAIKSMGQMWNAHLNGEEFPLALYSINLHYPDKLADILNRFQAA